jgi:uncharacterized repeat protein (TIGR01451 family)
MELASQPARAAGPWYVAPGGDDGNDCLSPATPCASIDGALGKPGFVISDTVLVASGTYTGTGDEVVLLDQNVTLSGGWNVSFTVVSGTSIIDGQGARRGVYVNSSVIATIDYFVFKNGYAEIYGGGVYNDHGILTLTFCTVSNNAAYRGGGIYSYGGNTTLNSSTVSENLARYEGGGIASRYGVLTLNSSTVRDNTAIDDGGGLFNNNCILSMNNCTISRNTALTDGGGISNHSYGTLRLFNSTVSDNQAGEEGGGIYYYHGSVTLHNTIVADNTASVNGPDCANSIGSGGYNLIGDTTGCTFSASTGDLTNMDPNLGRLIGSIGLPRYRPLLPGSPAIDAGNPAGCSGSAGPLSADQRGASRVGICDIGAYEYVTPGPPVGTYALSGTPQTTPPTMDFRTPLQAVVLDAIGSPVSNTLAIFTAPQSGPSGLFSDTTTFTTTTLTDRSGIATAPILTANGLTGTYPVTASAAVVITPASFLLSNTAWYVATDGDDDNACTSPLSPCATVNGALDKDAFSPGNTVVIATGTYTGTEVVLLDKDVVLSGGWNGSFTSQNGISTIDGQDTRRGIYVGIGVTAIIEDVNIQNGIADEGGGIYNYYGSLSLARCTVSGNEAYDNGGGISNGGILTINNCAISGNTASGFSSRGGGLYNWDGTLTMVNCTASGNLAHYRGGGIYNNSELSLFNSTVSENTSWREGGGLQNLGGTLILENSIIDANTAAEGPDCFDVIDSSGYNIIGSTSGCTFNSTTGDLTNVSADLGPLIEPPDTPGYYPLLVSSPAINAGDPTGCTDHLGTPLTTDQRGAARIGTCDIGAYEYTTPGPSASIHPFAGTPQNTPPLMEFRIPLQTVVLDGIGSPVVTATVTYSAPISGPSGAFAGSTTFTTTLTDESGIATPTTFAANALQGSYIVSATANGVVTPAHFELSNTGWYVAPDGDDGNTCTSPLSPCATVNGTLGKPSLIPGDTVVVATGTYTGTGAEVILIDKDAILSGGWSSTFTVQNGTTIIDGQAARRAMYVDSDVTATVERFAFHNGWAVTGGGIEIEGDLTLDSSTVSNNVASNNGGGIYIHYGILSLSNCTVSGNTTWIGGGIYNYNGYLTVNGSTVSNNIASGNGGGIENRGNLTLNNSTVSGNQAGGDGGGVKSTNGTVILNSSTVSGNEAGEDGGGIYGQDGTVTLYNSTISENTAGDDGGGILSWCASPQPVYFTLQNSILAGNTASSGGPDCYSGSCSVLSAGYNIIADVSQCTFSAGTGDLTNVDADLGALIGPLGTPHYHPLLIGSPAIDGGNPAGCNGSTGPLNTDQRGVARVGRCDIGAYEYTPSGPPVQILAQSGTPQHTQPSMDFGTPLQAMVLDTIGSPVSNMLVTFAAPISGPSGVFSDTGTYTTTTPTDASGIAAAATLTANGLQGSYLVSATATTILTPAYYYLTNILWYVAPDGDDSSSCTSPISPCATVNGVLAKPGFIADDIVLAASGTYTDSIHLNQGVILSGGWDSDFITQFGVSILDGAGIQVDYGVNAFVERFTIQDVPGSGVGNWGTLTLENCTITGNSPGIENWGSLTLNSCTVTDNFGLVSGGIEAMETVAIRNTILAGNTSDMGSPDCDGNITSLGYNLIGDTSGCSFSAAVGDLTNVDAKLGPLVVPSGYHPLLFDSPAINGGNPSGCRGSTGFLDTDQRGFPRFGRCDIGAYEAQSVKTANRTTALPGDHITYTIALQNGSGANSSFQITDTLPISLTYADGSLSTTSGSYGSANNVVTWTGTISVGESVSITYGCSLTQTVSYGSSVANSAVISGGGELVTRTATTEIWGRICGIAKYGANPVFSVGTWGTWDDDDVYGPVVLLQDGIYMMWYTGDDGSSPSQIGLATSPDGINWTRHGSNPVLSPSAGWETNGVRVGSVISHGGQYHMWYHGYDSNWVSRIGYASSPDGISWAKSGSNPVLNVGTSTSWESDDVRRAAVTVISDTFHMWYTGNDGTVSRLGHATSSNGVSWTKDGANPIIENGSIGTWDWLGAYGPSIIKFGNEYMLWYSGETLPLAWQTGYATSDDGINWTRGRMALPEGGSGTFDVYSADYASVLLDGNGLHLWYSGLDANRYTIGYATVGICGARATTDHALFLPLVQGDYPAEYPCTYYSDRFSDSTSGWPVDNNSSVKLGYTSGQYQIRLKSPWSGWHVTAGALAEEFVVEVRARRTSGEYGAYGIEFGINEDWSQLYQVLIDANYYSIWRYQWDNWYEEQDWTYAGRINTGSRWNNLRVVRDDGYIRVSINGKQLTEVYNSSFTGLRRIGLVGYSAFDRVELRFDDFALFPLDCDGIAGRCAIDLGEVEIRPGPLPPMLQRPQGPPNVSERSNATER